MDAKARQEAMQKMLAPKPGSKRPPNLTVTEDSHRNCGNCEHFNGAGQCRLYSYPVQPNETCDSWAPTPT